MGGDVGPAKRRDSRLQRGDDVLPCAKMIAHRVEVLDIHVAIVIGVAGGCWPGQAEVVADVIQVLHIDDPIQIGIAEHWLGTVDPQ